MSRILAAPLALALLAGLPLAAAMASPSHDARRAEEQRAVSAAPIDAAAAISAMRAAGYTAVHGIEWEHGRWEGKATDTAGRHAKLQVHATTGAVTPRVR
jgi:hypothetical protein